MKRYVKEFANDVIADLKWRIDRYPEFADEYRDHIAEIGKLIEECQSGQISDILAARLIGEHADP